MKQKLILGNNYTFNVLILKEIYRNNDFGIFICKEKSGTKFTASGNCIAEEGKSYQIDGVAISRKDELQLKLTKCVPITPFSEKGILAYLQTVPSLKSKAELIVEKYKENSIEILKTNPEKVSKEIKGIGIKSAKKWSIVLQEGEVREYTIIKLLSFELTPNAAQKLYAEYGQSIVQKIEENPFMLARNVAGFGFVRCDKIARVLGIEKDNIFRVCEGIIYSLEESTYEGSCFLTLDECVSRSSTLLEVDSNKILQGLNNLILQNRIIREKDFIYLKNIHTAEVLSANGLKQINKSKSLNLNYHPKIIKDMLVSKKIELEQKQLLAIQTITQYAGGAFILNGSAGCGKTFVIKLIIAALKLINGANYRISIFAPTGKAAKVASKAIGLECKTIHRGLEYIPEFGFSKNEDNPIESDCIIIDESSMIDLDLFYSLIRAIEPHTKLILIGDINQLPSIGAGNVLRDIINSNIIPIITLDVIKRQTLISGIVKAAIDIIEEKMPIDSAPDFFIKNQGELNAANYVVALTKSCISKGNSLDNIQILSPQRKGPLGVYYLNYLLQKELNPDNPNEIPTTTVSINLGTEVEHLTLFFRLGDKVINTKNTYDAPWLKKTFTGYQKTDATGIFNGDCGYIIEIANNPETKQKEVYVQFEDKIIKYAYAEVCNLELAYALTVHKAQGSEWDYVFISTGVSHVGMLDKNLLYTAITRARIGCAIISKQSAIEIAVKTNRVIKRNTLLKERLMD